MFCNSCGAQWPDGTRFCGQCGATMVPATPAEPVVQEPVVTPEPVAVAAAPVQEPVAAEQPVVHVQPPVYQSAPTYDAPKPANKSGTKSVLSILVLITFLASLALIAFSAYLSLTTSIFELPLVKTAFTVVEEDPDELVAELEDAVEEAKDSFEQAKFDMTDEEEDLGEELLDVLDAMADKPSALNLAKGIHFITHDYVDFMIDNNMEDVVDESFSQEELDQFDLLKSAILGVILAFYFLPLLFALLGGLIRSTGLTVTAAIFTAISQLILVGPVWTVITLVVYIVQAVGCSRLRKLRKAAA